MSLAQETLRGPSGLIEDWWRREPTLAAFALLMVVAMAPTLIAMAIDGRTFNGINVWIKPFKFESSLAIFYATLAWFWGYLDAEVRARKSVRLAVLLICGTGLFEVGYITFRAALAEASHFNNSTRLTEALYGLMGVGILIQVSLAAWAGRLILRSREGGIAPVLRLAIGLGLIGGNILGAITGGYMSAQTGHWVGGVANDATGVFFFGWSRTGGDLRVAHFVGLHAIQGIPVIGYLVRNVSAGQAVVWASLAIWTVVTAFFFIQAIGGRPLLPL
ncbi:MAG TPA: hypothetical protein VIG34_11090 [Xanthobacteraceae bacterium]|jgi:hypothetical protein